MACDEGNVAVRRMIDEHRTLARAVAACAAALLFLFSAPLGAAPLGDDDDVIVLGIPTVAITAPAQNTFFSAPASIPITATAKAVAGTISRVDFYQGSTLIGSDSTSPYNATWSSVAAGVYSLTAKAKTSLGFVSTSGPVTVKVCNVPTATLTAPASGTIVNQGDTVNLQATATSPANACAITKVEFYQQIGAGSPVLIGTALGNPPYLATWSTSTAATYTLTAKAYDQRGVTGTSPGVTLIVNAKPAVTMTSPAANATFNNGSAISLAATASDSDGTISKVEFFTGSTSRGVGMLNNNQYTATWTPAAPGAYSLFARATDNRNATKDSATVGITVCYPSVSFTAPTAGQVVSGPSVTLTASASALAGCGSITKVEFYNGATLLGTVTASPYTYNWLNVAAGSYTITARAYDSRTPVQTVQASVSFTVNAPPTATLSTTVAGTTYNAPATLAITAPGSLTLNATAADSDGTIAKVEFYDGGTLLGATNSAPYSYAWSNILAGAHSVTSRAYDNRGATGSSPVLTVNGCGLPAVAITSPSAGQLSGVPGSFSLAATASTLAGCGTITKVEFYNGASLISTDTTSPYTAAVSSLAGGTYTFVAKAYSSLGSTAQASVSATVCGLPTSTLTSPPAGQAVAAPGSFTLNANATTNANCSIQRVEFYNGASLLNTDTTSPYSFVWSGVAVGSYTLKARSYDTLGQFTDSASVGVSVIVDRPPTISSITPASPQVLLGDSISLTVVVADQDSGSTLAVQLLNGGTPIGSVTRLAGTNTFVVTWAPATAGNYNLSVQVTDNYGLSATQVVSATVSSVPSGTVGDADLVYTAPVSTSNVGTTAGVFGVNESGAATYSIPIQVPPGTAGMQPSLALTYSSQGGDGHVGVGWSLSGLSAISRCPATEAQDGARLGINYDDQPTDDAFCLDGQRLIPVGQSGNATDYRTEIESYSRIVRYDESPDLVVGPSRFRVWTKSGQILDYGSRWWVVSEGWLQNGAAGRVNTIKVWALDRVMDRVGNYMEIDYKATNGALMGPWPSRGGFFAPMMPTPIGSYPDVEFWPEYIRYYGVHNVGVSSPGYNEVRLIYSDRGFDKQRFYDQGAGAGTLTQKLDAIQVTVDKSSLTAGAKVRTYYLNYAASPTSRRLLLQNVQECAPDNGGTCLAPTTFDWTTSALDFLGQGSSSTITTAGSGASQTKVVDLNGDGRSDLISHTGNATGLPQNWEVCLGPLSPSICTTYATDSFGTTDDMSRWVVADVDGNGKSALITYEGTANSPNWKVCRFNGSGFDPCQLWSGPILYRSGADWNEFFWGDFNGDGKIDILSYPNKPAVTTDGVTYYNLWDLCLSTGSGFTCQRDLLIPLNTTSGNLRDRILIADVNGDGKVDYLERASQDDNDDQWRVCLSNFALTAGTVTGQFDCSSSYIRALKGQFSKFVIMDMNGDGLADMIARADGGNKPVGEACSAGDTCWQVCPSTGDGAFEFKDPTIQWTAGGLVDGAGNPVDPYAAPRCRYWSGLNAPFVDVKFGDFNGDGRTDIAKWNSTARVWSVCFSTGTDFNCPTSSGGFPAWPLPDMGNNSDRVLTGDFNGDGKTDVIAQFSGTSWAMGLAGNAAVVPDDGFADQINKITTGLGATTSLAYAPLTDVSVYKKGNTTAGARELVIQSPLYVVKETQASNAVSGQFVNTYFYEGLKGKTDGRGIEGFFRRRMLDGNGILSEIETEQTWPLTGRPKRTTKWAPVSGNRPNPATVLPTSPVDVANAALVKVNEATQTWSSRSYGAGSPYQGGTIAAIAEPRSFARFVYQVHMTASTEQSFEFPGGTALPLTTTTIPLSQIDDIGNVKQITVVTADTVEGGNYTKQTINTYTREDTANWIIGRLTSAAVTSTKPTGENMTRKSSWTYGTVVPNPDYPFDNACWWGFVCTETIEPGHAGDTTDLGSGLWQETRYTYDRFGNKSVATVSFQEKDANNNVVQKQRTSTSCYANYAGSTICTNLAGAADGPADNRGRFVLSVTNALSQTETRQYDTRFGAPSVVNGPNGLSSTVAYDRFGRKVSVGAFDGPNGSGHRLAQSETLVQSCASADTNPGPGVPAGQVASYANASTCQAGESYRVRTKASGNAGSYIFFDNLQRERRTVTKAFNDQLWATVATTYDALGRKSSLAKPAGSGTITTTLGYDVLNRVTTETTTGNNGATKTTVATTTYSGLTTSVTRTNPSGSGSQTTSRTVNSQGQITLARDANNKSTTFLYDASGNLKQATGPTGIAVMTVYDLRGRKSSMTDPDMGSWRYFYNGVGELTRQRDGKGQDTRLLYDALGRMVERREYTGAEGGNVFTGTLWSYDSCALVAIGKLCSTETHSASPYSSTNLVSRQASTYDGAARPATTTTTIGSASYLSATQYDSNGRVAQIEYPSGLIVKQTYTAWGGNVASVTDATGGTTYWQATNRMADGQIAAMKVGPHATTKTYDPLGRVASIATAGVQNATYVFDEVGNLTRRVDATVGQADETYGYDLLNRLITANAITIASYDDSGNIASRLITGTNYSYSYQPGTHRLVSLNDGAANSYDPNSYDPNGNFVAGGNRSVTSNAFNMPSQISGGGNTIDFAYDSAHARIQEVSSATGITNFVGSQFYEEQFRPDGSTYRRHYIGTPEGIVALIVQRYRPQGNDTLTRYWHKDHLGSIAVITADTGAIVERFTYDVWGRRTQAYIATGEPLEERGYTGHETLDEVAVAGIGLVHMNGRIYDPFTGRFLSADPFVQSPYDGQSYNRYSYVLNNPLSFTDPTGFSWWTKWRRPLIAIAVAWAVGPVGFWAAQGGLFGAFAGVQIGVSSLAAIGEAQFLSAVAGGFAAGGIMGGNLESAVQGAFFASVTFGIGTLAENGVLDSAGKVVAHAIVGCARSAAAGGNCRSGALAAGFAEFAGPVLEANKADNLITRLVVGGVGSRLGGGSFQSGAYSAAFVYLFNEALHSRESSVSLYGRYGADVGNIWCYPACLHLSVVISDQYSGVTLIQGEPDWPVRSFEGSALVSPSMSAETLARFQTNSVFGPVELPVPDGMSARGFANALVANASAFTPGSVSYRIPYLGSGYLPPGQYNSNSFASGLLQSVYGYVPAVNFGRFQAPGWGNPLPRQMFGGGG